MSRFILFSMFFFVPSFSYAMCVRANYEIISWNASGNSVLLHQSKDGPEGGGSNSYIIFNFDDGSKTSYTFSSNFSNGASEQESVSNNSCKDAVTRANQTLAKLNYKSSFKENCSADRANMLIVKDEEVKQLEDPYVIKIANDAGINKASSPNLLPTPLHISTKDNIHYIAVGPGCNSVCSPIILDADKHYKKTGDCE